MITTFTRAILPYYNTGFSPSASVVTGLLFCGAMGLLTLFVISFYLINKKSRIFLYYGLFVILSLLGGIINLQYDIALTHKYQEMTSAASLWLEVVTLLAFSSYSLFTIRLLDIKEKHKGVYRWVLTMAYASFVYVIIYTALYSLIKEYEGLYFLISRSIVIFMSLTALIWLIIKIKSPVKGLFIIGSLWYLFGALFASIVQLVPNLPFEFVYQLRTTIYFEIGLLLETFCFGLAISYRVYLLNKTKQKEEEYLRLQAEYEKNLAQAEMLASRMQINPHFIFNSLNSIKYLVQSRQNDKATKYITVFSRFNRMFLENGRQPLVSLNEEMKMIRNYLLLEANRFEDDFSYDIKIEEGIDSNKISVPPLLLQPFIENAIWHGLLPSGKEKKILTINVTKVSPDIQISIKDNGVGITEPSETSLQRDSHKNSMGMKITKDRILQYNKNYRSKLNLNVINIPNMEGGSAGTEVRLTIQNS